MAIDGTSSISSNIYASALNSVTEQITSGQRVNRASDDPANQAVIAELTSQVNGQDIATQNANSGIALLQTVDGASEGINNALLRLNELAVQAQNGTLNNQQRNILNEEFQQTLSGIQQTAETTQFNDINLLDGSTTNINIALDGSNNSLELADLSTTGLAINGLDISNPNGAENALQGITNAIEQLSSQRAEFGAQQNGLTSTIDNIQNQNINANQALSRINDTDYGRALTEQVRLNVLQDTAIAMQAQQNQSRSSVLQLLNS